MEASPGTLPTVEKVPSKSPKVLEEEPLADLPRMPPALPVRKGIAKGAGVNLQPALNPVVARTLWGASSSYKPLDRRNGPVSKVLCTHTAGETCDTTPKCIKVLRELQSYFIKDKGEIDLPYSFLVGGDGKVYEGRGWSSVSSYPKHLPDRFNDGKTLTVAYMGDFNSDNKERPPEHMVQARRTLIQFGRERGLLHDDRPVFCSIVGRI